MSDLNTILRRSSLIDTSNAEKPVMQALRLEGGVFVDNNDDVGSNIFQGRLSLGIIGVLILGAVAFYYYTRSIQGGG